MEDNKNLQYLIKAWNEEIKDHPIVIEEILNATPEYAVNFFLKCFSIYRQFIFPDEDELCIPEDKKQPMAVKFVNEILNGKLKVGYLDILRPNKTRMFCFKFALNFILHSLNFVPKIHAIVNKVRSKIVAIRDDVQDSKTKLNQLSIKREMIRDKIAVGRKELESLNAECNIHKQQALDFQVKEMNFKESIQQLAISIPKKENLLQNLEAATKEKTKLYSCISNWDTLLSEFNQLEEEKDHYVENDASVSEALQEKQKCINNFELIIESLKTLKEPLEDFATNYPTLKETYDNKVKMYDEKLKQLENAVADKKKLIDGINIDADITTTGKNKVGELKVCISELEKRKFAILQRNDQLKRDNDCNIKSFISTMNECEALELEMQMRYNDGIRVIDDISSRLNCNLEKITKALDDAHIN